MPIHNTAQMLSIPHRQFLYIICTTQCFNICIVMNIIIYISDTLFLKLLQLINLGLPCTFHHKISIIKQRQIICLYMTCAFSEFTNFCVST